jgi:nucleoside-diphosphate-sugar epimerase
MTAVNTDAALGLARAALAAGATRHVFASTVLVYGAGHPAPQDEKVALRPVKWYKPGYPASKLAAEEALRELHASGGLDLRILRLAYVYGAGDARLAEALKFVERAHPADRLPMVHHVDVAQAVLRALRTEGVAGRTFNVADDAPVTAAEVLWLNGLEPAADGLSRTPGDPFLATVRTERIRRELGWRPVFPTVYTARDAGAM